MSSSISEARARIVALLLFVWSGAAFAQYGLQSSYQRLPGVDIIGPVKARAPAIDSQIRAAPPAHLGQPAVLNPSRDAIETKPGRSRAELTESTDGWVPIKSEDFEGAFPNEWTLYGTPTWDDESYRYHNGGWSGYCVGSSVSPPGPYPPNANSWMVYGPFSLVGATDARVRFYRWLETEASYDFLEWRASTDGTNFYGWQISGTQAWTSDTFDLKTVPTLGNLCGQSQVWIAFRFTSDVSNEYEGAYIDDVVLQKYTSSDQPDLTYYQPSGWDFPIVPSNFTGTHTVPSPLFAGTTYIDWAGTNAGTAATEDTFFTYLCCDGTPLGGWFVAPPVDPGYWYHVDDFQTSITAGNHTLMTMQDSTNRIAESNENNNRYSHSWTWDASVDYDHVTITSSAFAPRFASLSSFVEAHLGLNDTVVTLTDIYAAFPGRDNPEKIRNFIKYAYTYWSTTHVLLGGDADIVPCRKAYGDVKEEDLLPCDLYYSDLDGDWDANANSVFGEVGDSVDMYPEVYVGRASASVEATVDQFVQKFLTYSSDSTAAYLSKVVLGGFDLFDTIPTYGESTMVYYENNYVPSSMTPCNRVYDSYTSNHKSAMMAYLNAGQHFWIHTDHGLADLLGCGSLNHDWNLYPSDLSGLTNGDNLTIFISIACFIGAFDTSDCIAENFLNADYGGGVAAVVNSREGWYARGDNPQRSGSALYVEEYLYYLFGHPTGNASLEDITLGKATLVPLADTNRVYRWCMYEMNLFGDPAMQVWIPTDVGVSESPGSAGSPGALTIRAQTHFESGTRLQVRLPQSGHVRLGIYDRTGRKVKYVVNSHMQAGYHDFIWDGRTDNGADVSAGVYYARLETDQNSCQCKLVRLGKELP